MLTNGSKQLWNNQPKKDPLRSWTEIASSDMNFKQSFMRLKVNLFGITTNKLNENYFKTLSVISFAGDCNRNESFKNSPPDYFGFRNECTSFTKHYFKLITLFLLQCYWFFFLLILSTSRLDVVDDYSQRSDF